MGIFGVIDSVVRALEGRFQVTEHRVDPTELGALRGLTTATREMALMTGGRLRHAVETGHRKRRTRSA